MNSTHFFLSWALLCGLGFLSSPTGRAPSDQTTSFPSKSQNSPTTCLSYEPSVVQLTGTIIRKTFPGPPNYTNVKHGDSPERAWFLVLKQPICVQAGKDDPSWMLYDLLGIESPFQLDLQDSKSGEKTTLELAGVSFPDRDKIAAARYSPRQRTRG